MGLSTFRSGVLGALTSEKRLAEHGLDVSFHAVLLIDILEMRFTEFVRFLIGCLSHVISLDVWRR
jgi:hypothetical protein